MDLIPDSPEIQKTPYQNEDDLKREGDKPKEETEEQKMVKNVAKEALTSPTDPKVSSPSVKPLSDQQRAKQLSVIEKMKQEAAKTHITGYPLDRELKTKKDEMEMGLVTRQIQKSVEGLKSSAYELSPLGNSANPVAKLRGTDLVKKEAVTSRMEMKASDITDVLTHFSASPFLLGLVKKQLTDLISEYKNKPIDQDTIGQLRARIKDIKTSAQALPSYPKQEATLGGLTGLSETLQKLSDSSATMLANVPTKYNKDEVLTELRNLLNQTPDEDGAEEILSQIQTVNASQGSYIDEKTLNPDVLEKLKSLPNKTMNEYISLTDFELANADHPMTANILAEVEKTELSAPGFVVKSGFEVRREMLGNILVASLGLHKPLVPKWEVGLEGVKLGETENPKGIASRFVEKSKGFHDKTWHTYNDLKMKFAQAEFLGPQLAAFEETGSQVALERPSSPEESHIPSSLDSSSKTDTSVTSTVSDPDSDDDDDEGDSSTAKKQSSARHTVDVNRIEDLKNIQPDIQLENAKRQLAALNDDLATKAPELEAAKAAILEKGNVESVQTHVLTDLLLCSNDSHSGQYMSQDKELFNIDFARFLPPHDSMRDLKGVAATFRSTLLDHPAADEPLSEELINTVKSWDMGKLEENWKKDGLIGEPKFFKDATKRLEILDFQRDAAQGANESKLKEMYAELGLETPVETYDSTQLREVVIKETTKQFENLKNECYSKIHPQAFAGLKKRMQALQGYIREPGSEPTLKGAFNKMYPQLAPFMKVLGRFQSNPGENLFAEVVITKGVGGQQRQELSKRPLKSIIEQAELRFLATPEEIQEMKEALAVMERESPPMSDIRTTNDQEDNVV